MKVLSAIPEKCSGCRICEFWCVMEHHNLVNPVKARIRILRQPEEFRNTPMVCHQCQASPCVRVCPEEALSRDEKTGAIRLDAEQCTGCRLCLNACPHGAIAYDQESGQPIICDLCGENPACVRVCPEGALQYIGSEFVDRSRKMQLAEKR